MKKIIYFDCISGISGDMTLGALIHMGVDLEYLQQELAKLNLNGYLLTADKKQVNGIGGIDVNIRMEEEPKAHTSYKDIVRMIDNSSISENAKITAKNIFSVIAAAEASVHDKNMDEVHFHEVGAVDSIIDIVGTAIAVDFLDIDTVFCSPVCDGSGTIECRHGEIPVPVPAVMEMAKDCEIRIKGVDADTELVTPTGYGILKGLDAVCDSMPEMNVTNVGYGFGKRETGRFNGLRIIMGKTAENDGGNNNG